MGAIINGLREIWRSVVTPPVMAGDVALGLVDGREKELELLADLRSRDPVPEPNMGPWIKSYRHIRPFPESEPRPEMIFARWCWGTLARSEDYSNCRAWLREKHRRQCVEFRWLMRQAERRGRAPVGHDHRDWI